MLVAANAGYAFLDCYARQVNQLERCWTSSASWCRGAICAFGELAASKLPGRRRRTLVVSDYMRRA
jgi:hypothetical protein